LAYLAILELFYSPHSPKWLNEWYAVAAGGYMLFRILAVAEAFLLDSRGHQIRRQIAVSAAMLALACASIMAWQITGPTMLLSAIQARRVGNVGLFAFLGIYCLLRWSMGDWRSSMASRHILFLLAMSAALVIPTIFVLVAPRHWWWCIDPIAYLFKSALLAGWALLAIPGPPAVLIGDATAASLRSQQQT
jgi:hypothetical protein